MCSIAGLPLAEVLRIVQRAGYYATCGVTASRFIPFNYVTIGELVASNDMDKRWTHSLDQCFAQLHTSGKSELIWK
jgi:hypothetical protein